MIPGIFITATGTDVGKTMMAAGILRRLRRTGENAMVMKPVQTGGAPDASGRLSAPDISTVLRMAEVAVDDETLRLLSPCVYAPACSPHLAARLAGRPVSLDAIAAAARHLSTRYPFLVVEGAGGVMAPLNETETMLDLAASLAMPAVLVSHGGLGAINHVLLSLAALRSRSLPILGVILNETQPVAEAAHFIHDDNACAIEALGHVRVLARVPWLGMPPDLLRLDAALATCDFRGGF
jgi:dethiobiotin synthetase